MFSQIDQIPHEPSQEMNPFIRYTRPTGFDFAPYGQQWIFMNDGDKQETYIQANEDEDSPKWERMGVLLEIAFEDLFKKKEFIYECLRMFKYKEEDPLIKITEIIKNHQR
jgi:hypothetical protein